MNSSANHIVTTAKFRWGSFILTESILIGWIIGLVTHFSLVQWQVDVSLFIVLSVATIIGGIIGGFLYRKRVSDKNVLRLIDRQFEYVEESAHLLLKAENELTFVGNLQRSKVENVLSNSSRVKLHHNHGISTYLITLFVVALLYVSYLYITTTNVVEPIEQNAITYLSIESVAVTNVGIEPVEVGENKLTITPPKYTKLRGFSQDKWEIKAIEGSMVRWELEFSGEVKKAELSLSSGDLIKFSKRGNSYVAESKIREQGYYELLYADTTGNQYSSDFYKIEMTKDTSPAIKIEGIPQYAEFDFDETESVDFVAHITDDFGVTDASITATITKGSGESVKFREEKLSFGNKLAINSKNQHLERHISFSEMDMEPGDELYFYVEAKDNKSPMSNITRSETYFLVLRDTSTYEFSLEGNLGVDLMPEYFRSQRQIIIDSEKLIANKAKFSKYDFNNKSNELGFDQKTLRLKYGQFMGEEDDSGIAIEDDVEVLEDEQQGDEENDDDPLEGYTHAHDTENEHNLVDNSDHEVNEEGEVVEDPLEEYQHAHDTEEVNTFLTNTIKGKLRAAMNLMWDAELYLRLYQPENSLPYQYKALKLIKEIKNHARIYVHRIGFDPPPLKEESRLSGDLGEVNSRSNVNNNKAKNLYDNTEKVIALLNAAFISDNDIDMQLYKEAGKEIALMAIENPGRYLSTLQWLKQLSEGSSISESQQEKLIKDLISILPNELSSPSKDSQVVTKLQELYYKQLGKGGSDR